MSDISTPLDIIVYMSLHKKSTHCVNCLYILWSGLLCTIKNTCRHESHAIFFVEKIWCNLFIRLFVLRSKVIDGWHCESVEITTINFFWLAKLILILTSSVYHWNDGISSHLWNVDHSVVLLLTCLANIPVISRKERKWTFRFSIRSVLR